MHNNNNNGIQPQLNPPTYNNYKILCKTALHLTKFYKIAVQCLQNTEIFL